jgi:hypothetical protein
MVSGAFVQGKIDYGRGIAAQKLGQPYNAYRVGPTSSGDFPGGWQLLTAGTQIFRRRLNEVAKLDVGMKETALFLEIIADMGPYLLGDCFVQVDAPLVPGVSYGAGATSLPGTPEFNGFTLAWHQPVMKNVGARLDRRVMIFRPATGPKVLADGSDYWASTHDNDSPLILANGQYSFGAPGSGEGSMIPAGISSQHRQSDRIFGPGVPGMPKPVKWFFYVPPLPGYLPAEGDAIIDENGARYVVVSPYEQEAGVVGNQLVCDRKIAQV